MGNHSDLRDSLEKRIRSEWKTTMRYHLTPVRMAIIKKIYKQGIPGGAVVENLPANAGDMGSSPGLGRSHMPRSN